jgi:penicillin amidase
MGRFLKVLLIIIVVIGVLGSGIWFGGRWILSLSVAEYEGEIEVPGIQYPVEITFDAKGIPQIWAETDRDLMFSIGWLHASERLFQMELVRRMAEGELSEVFGELAYEIDLFQRKIGIKRIAQQGLETIDPRTRAFLEQYCRGINAWIAHKTILPPEFVFLRLTPTPWKPIDCLSIMVYQTWFTTEADNQSSEYRKLIEKFGGTLAQYLQEPVPWSSSTIPSATIHGSVLESVFEQDRFPLRMTTASNSWVVAPYKSTTGAALHASDPHLRTNQIPNFWYIMGMHSKEGIDFLGVTTPGLPFGVMGHNGSIAYAFTVALVDIIDYYRYRRHPDDPMQIMTENGYQKLSVIQEEIHVKGEKQPRTEEIYMTDRGVIVEETKTDVVALRWAGFDFNAGKIMQSAFTLMKAQNFWEFRAAVTNLGALDVNWTYSDARGNIGYQLGVPIPQRSYSNTHYLLAGEDPLTAWHGYYPLSETPSVYNPKEGWIATCNNRIVPEDWPYELPGYYYPYRFIRASTLLSQKNLYSPEDMGRMQMDIISGAALQWKNLLINGAEQLGYHDLAQEIREWDGRISLDSELAVLFIYWRELLPKFIFEDDLGKEWCQGPLMRELIVDIVLTHQIQDIIDDQRTPNRVETIVDIAALTLERVLPMARGKKMRDINFFEIHHPLSKIKILDYWLHLNRGPFHLPGDSSALNSSWLRYDEERDRFHPIGGASMRYVLNWSDLDTFTIHTNLGQSGNPFSPHYDDFLDIWRKGERWVVPFTKEKVYARKTSLLTLKPQSRM